MGNRGTTPSWDDEEIAKYGLLGHFSNVRYGYRVREVAHKKERRRKIRERIKEEPVRRKK